MTALDDFYHDLCRGLTRGLGEGWVYDPTRLGALNRDTAFGAQGLTVTCSTKGVPHTTVTLAFGLRFVALAELRDRADLHPMRGFDVSLNSHNAAALRGTPGRRGLRLGSRFDTGPWQAHVETGAAHTLEAMRPFVHGVALPYLEHYADLDAVRTAIGRRDGWCTSVRQVEVAMLIDVLQGETRRLRRYRDDLPEGFRADYDRMLPRLDAPTRLRAPASLRHRPCPSTRSIPPSAATGSSRRDPRPRSPLPRHRRPRAAARLQPATPRAGVPPGGRPVPEAVRADRAVPARRPARPGGTRQLVAARGAVRLRRPGGRPAASFVLASFDADRRKAVFENPKKDYPTRIVYERKSDTQLVITLSDPHGDDKKVEVFDLKRVTRKDAGGDK